MSAWIEIALKCPVQSWENDVALYMSAWIEIYRPLESVIERNVALYMSAWIEIYRPLESVIERNVALYMSAWIEISIE